MSLIYSSNVNFTIFCADILKTSRKYIRRERNSKDERKATKQIYKYLLSNIECSTLLRIVKQQRINRTMRYAITLKG